jgi:hypothetical protein
MASLFVRSAQFLRIIDDNGFLRYSAGMQTISAPVKTADPKKPDPFDVPVGMVATDPAPPGANVWSFSSKGNQIKVQTPEVISKELWDKLNAYVQILKPSE